MGWGGERRRQGEPWEFGFLKEKSSVSQLLPYLLSQPCPGHRPRPPRAAPQRGNPVDRLPGRCGCGCWASGCCDPQCHREVCWLG